MAFPICVDCIDVAEVHGRQAREAWRQRREGRRERGNAPDGEQYDGGHDPGGDDGDADADDADADADGYGRGNGGNGHGRTRRWNGHDEPDDGSLRYLTDIRKIALANRPECEII